MIRMLCSHLLSWRRSTHVKIMWGHVILFQIIWFSLKSCESNMFAISCLWWRSLDSALINLAVFTNTHAQTNFMVPSNFIWNDMNPLSIIVWFWKQSTSLGCLGHLNRAWNHLADFDVTGVHLSSFVFSFIRSCLMPIILTWTDPFSSGFIWTHLNSFLRIWHIIAFL